MDNQTWWYITRSAGIVAWLTLCLAVMWGLLMSTRIIRSGPKRVWLLETHKTLGALSVIFTFIHLVVLIPDSYFQYSVVDLVVPFTSNRNPLAQAFGVVAFWLILAIEISSLLRKRIPQRTWKYIHFSSALLFVVASVHGFMVGTDAKLLGAILFVVVISEPIFILVVLRIIVAKGKYTFRNNGHGPRAKVPNPRIPVARNFQETFAPVAKEVEVQTATIDEETSAKPVSIRPIYKNLNVKDVFGPDHKDEE